ncbi:MAG: hypothetical protein FJY85_20890, partial [Deltaproteobacteria bacterium]|nr:hypothetical protein [Deltaproteobacteria bacterium]
MISSRGLEKNSAPGRAVSTGGDQPRHRYGNTAWLVYGEPRRDLETVEEIEKFIPQPLTRGRGFFLSFKNRILASTLLVIVVVVIIIGITLQIAVFPSLKGDPAVITDLKVIHFLASVVVIIISWLFIERISVKITMPLYNLTYRADQISREAGARLAASEDGSVRLDNQYEIDQDDKFAQGDEIVQLTSSFNRMLFYLKA